MKKIIGLFVFTLSLFSDINSTMDDYRFPDAFMEDNNLVYDKMEIKKNMKEEKKEEEDSSKINRILNILENNDYNNMNMKSHSVDKESSMALIYMSTSFMKRQKLKIVGLGVGFLINDWLNTEFSAETSLKDDTLLVYNATNEYSFNVFSTKHMKINALGTLSLGGILKKKTKTEAETEKFFFAYGAGGEVEASFSPLKIVGGYKFEVFERKDTKAVKSSIFFVKLKLNFPL